MIEQATRPVVSLLELRLLFEDHPTPDLAVAMCQQVKTLTGVDDLIRVMYRLPGGGSPIAISEKPTVWLEDEFSYLHRVCAEIGVNRYRARLEEA